MDFYSAWSWTEFKRGIIYRADKTPISVAKEIDYFKDLSPNQLIHKLVDEPNTHAHIQHMNKPDHNLEAFPMAMIS